MKFLSKRILFLHILTLLIGGCSSDLLNTAPFDSISSNNMWTTDNLAEQGVSGVYAGLRQTTIDYYYRSAGNRKAPLPDTYVMSDCRASQLLMMGTATPNSGLFSMYWKEHYEGVSRANDAIDNLPNSSIDDTKKGRLLAECKFLRAFFYFRLNAVFQGVPLYLTSVEIDECVQGRETAEVVWNAIIDDLTDCINEDNLPLKYDAGNSNYGRVTKGAAYALRGKVYLWTKEWSKAEADFKKVGDCGYKLFQGGYKELFKEANEQCDEMIFSLQEMSLTGYGSLLGFVYGTPVNQGSGWIQYTPNVDFVDSYQNADGSPFSWDDIIAGYSTMPTKKRSVYFLRNNMWNSEISKMTSYGADISKYAPAGNEERIKKAYENRDPRLTANVVTPYSEFNGAHASTTPHTYTLRWPYRGYDNKEPYDMRSDNKSYYLYIYRKFVPEGVGESPVKLNGPIDIPYIRYAEVLLGLAEALNEQGKTEEAITYINKVRERAGVAGLNSNQYTQVTGQEDLKVRIQNERRWELAGENSSYYDELRNKTWKNRFFSGSGFKTIWGSLIYSYSWGGDYYYKWAIPAIEIERNPNIIQNEGWIN